MQESLTGSETDVAGSKGAGDNAAEGRFARFFSHTLPVSQPFTSGELCSCSTLCLLSVAPLQQSSRSTVWNGKIQLLQDL